MVPMLYRQSWGCCLLLPVPRPRPLAPTWHIQRFIDQKEQRKIQQASMSLHSRGRLAAPTLSPASCARPVAPSGRAGMGKGWG